jgi:maleate isomerase
MFGSRARIGYCSPPFVTESFCNEFYMMAPAGVSLMITTLMVTERAYTTSFDASHDKSFEAAHCMAAAGADVVVLGGNPINQSRGMQNLGNISDDLSRQIGVKVVTSTQSQTEALRALGAKKVATVHPFAEDQHEHHDNSIRTLGCEPAGVIGAGYSVGNLGRIGDDVALELSRQVMRDHPEADTIHPSCAQWATAHAIDQIKSELGVNLMTSQQAIFWKALRTAGIDDKIEGFGRLLREF